MNSRQPVKESVICSKSGRGERKIINPSQKLYFVIIKIQIHVDLLFLKLYELCDHLNGYFVVI